MLDLAVRQYRLTLLEPMLGTQPRDRALYAAYVAARAAGAAMPAAGVQEVASEVNDVQEIEERGWTGFAQDAEGIHLWDYQLRGFLKEAARVLDLSLPGKRKSSVALGPSVIDRHVFVTPRRIRIAREGVPLHEPDETLERPLRAMTAQGPRVSLVRSDVVREGATLDISVSLLGDRVTHELIERLLDYGALQGLGQWRNGSWGRFSWEAIEM